MKQRRSFIQNALFFIAAPTGSAFVFDDLYAQTQASGSLSSTLGTAPRASAVVYLHGAALASNVVLSYADLKQMPQELQGSFTQTRSVSGQEQKSVVQGVKLPSLIEKIGLSAAGKTNWKTLLITATATDDYRAVFTWPELINSPMGEKVLLLYERDGQALNAREGHFALQSAGDFRLGARHVRNLLRIEVGLL